MDDSPIPFLIIITLMCCISGGISCEVGRSEVAAAYCKERGYSMSKVVEGSKIVCFSEVKE